MSTSTRAMAGASLILSGGVIAAIGLITAAFGIYAIAAGYGFGHAGGWYMLLLGAIFSPSGIWLAKKGRRIYDAATAQGAS